LGVTSRSVLPLSLTIALLPAACGDGAGPTLPATLQITSVTPAAAAAAVETGATVAVVFNQPIDPATLTSATFRVTRDGVPLTAALSWDAATRTARAAAPFLPDVTYQVAVTTGVRTPTNAALSAPEVWSFTTRAWQAVTVDADGNVGFYTSLAVDASGRLHVSYYDNTNADLKYATCAADCALTANWQAATVDADGNVGSYTSLAVDAGGRLHVSYRDGTNADLKYATCAADCAVAANWQAATVDADGNVGFYTSLAVDAGGRLHVSYRGGTNAGLKYATCAADCAVAANWQAATVDADGNVGSYTSLAVDAGGRLHVSYRGGTNADLKYATCAADCAVAANWQAATVDTDGDVVLFTSLAADGSGRLHVSYFDDFYGNLKYATCAAGCDAAANWRTATVDADTEVVGLDNSLAVDAGGRLHVSYLDRTNGNLRYATCAADCEAIANWQAATVDADGNVGLYTSLAVDGSGRLHVSYYDNGNSSLKYIK
jgi:hypothetical protein